jgi:TrmH family RNA methyltransferase
MERRITSPQNPRVKRAASLRSARRRARESRYLIEGVRELRKAIARGVKLEEIFVCPDLCNTPASHELLHDLSSLDVAVCQVTPRVFEKLAFGRRAEGALAVGLTPDTRLERLSVPRGGLIAVLVGIEKPGNVGAVLRSADGAGLSAVIVADGATDLFNPNCIRASIGSIFTVPVATASSAEAIDWLRARQTRIFTARPDADVTYTAASLRGEAALVLGSESTGLPALWTGQDIVAIKIPMHGLADSLNISAAAAVLFYEALRQRTQPDEWPPAADG